MAFLQVCRQRLAAKKLYITQSRERVFVTSRDCPRRRPHSDFKNAPWNKGNEKRLINMEVEIQLAGFFAIVRGRFELLFWICEESHPGVGEVNESRVKEP